MPLTIHVTMPDGSRWAVPASVVSEDAIAYYREKDDFTESEAEMWRTDEDEIADWGRNNMNWEDVEKHAVRLPDEPKPVDYQEGWVNSEWKFVEAPTP